jgi:hypothetical protein
MLANNITTLEIGALRQRNPFSLGGARRNWELTFGAGEPMGGWLLPVRPRDHKETRLLAEVKVCPS